MKNLNITFEDKDFKKIENLKEAWKLLGKCTGWEDFIYNLIVLENEREAKELKLAKIRK